MVCLEFEPRAARWNVLTNPMGYGHCPKRLAQRLATVTDPIFVTICENIQT